MGLKPVRGAHAAPPPGAPEDQSVRQYRYLLLTAPIDALEQAHVEALNSIGPQGRQIVLESVQAELLTGAHLKANDTAAVAHLVTAGERRRPGALLTALPAPTLHDLARETIRSEPAFGLFGGYADWDGQDPEPPAEHEDSEHGEQWHSDLLHADDTAVWRAGSSGSSPWLPPSPRTSRHK